MCMSTLLVCSTSQTVSWVQVQEAGSEVAPRQEPGQRGGGRQGLQTGGRGLRGLIGPWVSGRGLSVGVVSSVYTHLCAHLLTTFLFMRLRQIHFHYVSLLPTLCSSQAYSIACEYTHPRSVVKCVCVCVCVCSLQLRSAGCMIFTGRRDWKTEWVSRSSECV